MCHNSLISTSQAAGDISGSFYEVFNLNRSTNFNFTSPLSSEWCVVASGSTLSLTFIRDASLYRVRPSAWFSSYTVFPVDIHFVVRPKYIIYVVLLNTHTNMFII